MAKITTDSDDSSVELVINHIRSNIISGKYPADTKLLPKLIAELCGTSFIPVREAMRALESEGLVSYIHNRGVWVTPLSIEDLDDLYAIRIELESGAVSSASKFSEKDIKALEQILAKMTEFRKQGEQSKVIKLNQDFHFFIYKKSNSPRRLRLIEQLWAHADRYQRLSLKYRHDAADAEHNEIVRHLAAGNNLGASEALTAHLQTTADLLRAGFESSKNTLKLSTVNN
jgi:DNA-binding GntR family transcriptional regulator